MRAGLEALARRWRGGLGAPVPIQWLAREDGWEIHEREIAPLRGYAVIVGGVRVIVVSAAASLAEQRATIAHELGHVLAGHWPLAGRRSGIERWIALRQEREADELAALLLIPDGELHGSVEEIAGRCDAPEWLARVRMERCHGTYQAAWPGLDLRR